ncbi:hypothetical protein EUTSA_v10022039mg [Eutrema salsugineum]|uniref:C2H2-type domain-containing protein n=1 Tax=Eutrema salsugineum TaxID=72664 RepID=V4LF99_EUTSA|nr:transcriptional regulator TAC1 [Eutrema salsugineum]ESQ49145.1 hypothetical protein EUTSA_v10022039mg [Eutrema salsugineum]
MDNIKNPNTPDDYSDRISKNSHQSGYNSVSRTYICSFCVRGFSNAQALGGHMNIHRRDRAKLRQKLMEEDNQDDFVAESDSSEVVSLDLNEQQEEALACDDGHNQDMDKDISPGQKLGFCVQESKLDTDNHGKVSIDGSSSSHHREIEGLDLELRLGQSTVEKKTT